MEYKKGPRARRKSFYCPFVITEILIQKRFNILRKNIYDMFGDPAITDYCLIFINEYLSYSAIYLRGIPTLALTEFVHSFGISLEYLHPIIIHIF